MLIPFKRKNIPLLVTSWIFLNIQDGEWLASLSFNILEAKHVIKKN